MNITRKAAAVAVAAMVVAGASACADPASQTVVKRNVNQMEHRGHVPGAASDSGLNVNGNEHEGHRQAPVVNPREHLGHQAK